MLGRLLVIAFACLLASLAAGLVVSLAVLLPIVGDLALGPFGDDAFGVVVMFGAIFVSAYALAPVLLVIVCAEAFSIRALIYYTLAGGLLGVVLYFNFSGWSARALTAGGFARRELEIMAAAGIVAGLVYWAIAGRKAGRWREPPQPAA
jgi:hypothetical protein